jgi:hypothetical protein
MQRKGGSRDRALGSGWFVQSFSEPSCRQFGQLSYYIFVGLCRQMTSNFDSLKPIWKWALIGAPTTVWRIYIPPRLDFCLTRLFPFMKLRIRKNNVSSGLISKTPNVHAKFRVFHKWNSYLNIQQQIFRVVILFFPDTPVLFILVIWERETHTKK